MTRQWGARHLVLHEHYRRGKTDHPHIGANAHSTEARLGEQPTEFLNGIPKDKGCTHDATGGRAHVPLKRSCDGGKARAMRDGTPDEQYEPPLASEHTIHLAEGLASVGKVLQSQL